MPGPVVHHIVAEKAFKRLRTRHKLDLTDPQVRASLLLGAQGPDILFFNVNDWPVVGGSPVADAVGKWFSFLDNLEEIKTALFAPLKDLDEQLEQGSATYAQIRAMIVALQGVADTLGATVNVALESLVVDQFAYYVFDNLVGHPSQQVSMLCDYTQPGNWWGFDMLHYRRSGLLTQTLFKKASTPAQKAYALGYLTHYATDVVLHPFINLIAGGPYRTHGQRHKVIETNQDVLAFNRFCGPGELGASELFKQYIFSADAEPDSWGDINFCRREVNPEVKDLLIASVCEVYQDPHTAQLPLFGRPLTADRVDMAFSIWLRWFEHSTSFLVDITPPGPINLTDELAEIWNDAQAKVAAAWSGVGTPGPGNGGVLGFFEAIAAAILVAFEVVGALLESTLTVIDAAIASGLAIVDAGLLDLLRMIQQFIYSDLFLRFHQVLVLQGLAYPTKEQADFPQTFHMRKPALRDSQGKAATDYLSVFYPLRAYRPAGQESEAHLVYPFSLQAASLYSITQHAVREHPCAFHGPQAYNNLISYELIDRYEDPSQEVYDRCATLGTAPGSYLDDAINVALQQSLGSAVPFSVFVYDRLSNGLDLNNFDLDGDRGYGHPSWRVFDPNASPSDAQPLVIERTGPYNTGSISPRHVKRV